MPRRYLSAAERSWEPNHSHNTKRSRSDCENEQHVMQVTGPAGVGVRDEGRSQEVKSWLRLAAGGIARRAWHVVRGTRWVEGGAGCFSVMTGCWAAGSCLPAWWEGSGTRTAPSVGPRSLVRQRCSTGGDSQAYQVKKKCLATEGFSCWASVCLIEVKWGGIKQDRISQLQWESLPSSQQMLHCHFQRTSTDICQLNEFICVFVRCPDIIWSPALFNYVCLSVFVPWRCPTSPLVPAPCQSIRFHSACVCFSDRLGRN